MRARKLQGPSSALTPSSGVLDLVEHLSTTHLAMIWLALILVCAGIRWLHH